ncbi:transcriptional regulator [Phosphitispora sp. TUW77]|uniref:transcriptional regulator n=1 Tax=Phosphitispora sp. TUW77 TaxID=3152361 RepID=UPI003AB42DA8
MKFHEKLDFLMNITKTTNSSLSMHISLDSSHISRLRRGQRRLVPNAEYVSKMAAYFVRQCVEDYQKNALLEILKKPVTLLEEPEKAAEQVYLWLVSDDKSESASVAGFLEGLNNMKMRSLKNDAKRILSPEIIKTEADISLYYGVEGKREAVIRFLSIALEKKKPGEILLYSDESMDWLTQDLAFQVKWMNLLFKVIEQGNRIKIIHTVSRNLNEMLEALSKWIPLYMTGAIEPYYYPKKRDGIFRRTIFIAPEKAGISVNSFETMSDNIMNVLFQDKKAVQSLVEEFNCYLNICKPLMRIFTDKKRQEYFQTLAEFEKETENTVSRVEGLSLVTMPEHVFRSLLERANIRNIDKLMDYFINRRERFLETIKDRKFNEIIKIDNHLEIKDGLIGYTGIDGLSEVRYTVEDYKEHLKNIIYLLNTYENYNVTIDTSPRRDDYQLYVKEDLGVIVEKITEPHVVFAINEGNMIASFWDYVNMILMYKPNKKSVIKQLEEIIADS